MTQWRNSRRIQGESEESQPTEPKDDAEARRNFWSFQGDFIYRHHNDPRVQLGVPKEETFSIPLKYIDVTRCTHTDLDVSFSRLRFGTDNGSGRQVKDAQYFHSLPRMPRLRSLLANQNDKGSLQKTHWRSSTSSRKSLVTC